MKYIATTNCEISITVDGQEATATIAKSKSNKFECHGYSCYSGTLTLNLSAITTSIGICESAQITINGSSDHIYANGSKVLLEGDSGSVVGSFENPTTKFVSEATIKATIISAGQDKVLAT